MRANRTEHIKKGILKDVYTFIFRNHNYLMILMMYICIYLQQIKHKKIVTVYTGVRQIVGVGGNTTEILVIKSLCRMIVIRVECHHHNTVPDFSTLVHFVVFMYCTSSRTDKVICSSVREHT